MAYREQLWPFFNMADAVLELRRDAGNLNSNHLRSFLNSVYELYCDGHEAFVAFKEALGGTGDPSVFDPQVRDCACQTRACLVLRILRNAPEMDAVEAFLCLLQNKIDNFGTFEYYRSSMDRRTERVTDFLERHKLTLFDDENPYRAQIFRFIIVSYILTKYKRSGYHKGVYKDTLASKLPNGKANVLKRMQQWLSSFSVDFIADHVSMAAPLAVRKNKLTVLPCYLTAMALASIWDREPHSNPMIMKLTVRRFCQQASQHGYHDHDSFYAWSAGGVRRLEAEEVANGQQVIQFFSVSVKGDVSVLEEIRTTTLVHSEGVTAVEEGVTRRGAATMTGAAQGGFPCTKGPTCRDFDEWMSRLREVDFREVFFTVCATHPQYPGTHFTEVSKEWTDLCALHAPEVHDSYVTALARKDTLACHRENLDLFMFEHITAAVHRAS